MVNGDGKECSRLSTNKWKGKNVDISGWDLSANLFVSLTNFILIYSRSSFLPSLPPVCVSLILFLFLPLSLPLNLYLSVHQSIYLSIYLSNYLSVSLPHSLSYSLPHSLSLSLTELEQPSVHVASSIQRYLYSRLSIGLLC